VGFAVAVTANIANEYVEANNSKQASKFNRYVTLKVVYGSAVYHQIGMRIVKWKPMIHDKERLCQLSR
jgi:hypothetical protein